MINITLSLSSTIGPFTGSLAPQSGRVGYVSLGELGFIDLLETQLGLKKPEHPNFQRKLTWLRALNAANSTPRFYSESLKTDPMAVAEHSLNLRDKLVSAGWNKQPVEGVTKLSDMAEVEKHFVNLTGTADRLLAVLTRLKALSKMSQISSIRLLDEQKVISYLWGQIISVELIRLGVKIEWAVPPINPVSGAKSDLGKLAQHKSQDFIEKTPKDHLLATGDESVVLLTGKDPWESARYLGVMLSRFSKAELKNSVIIAPQRHRGILRAAMLAQGIPFGGTHSEISYSRPALQILVLALSLLWDPKDPSAALALLTIDSSPVSKSFRNALVRSLNDSLAVGGRIWNEALEKKFSELLEKSLVAEVVASEADDEDKEANDTDSKKRKLEKQKQRIIDWFSAPAFKYEEGIPLAELVVACKRISKWLRTIALVSDKSSFFQAAEMSELVANLAGNLNEKTISRERLLHLLLDSVGDGIIADSINAQVGGPRVVTSPVEVASTSETIIWWDFTAANVYGQSEAYFSVAEIGKLKAAHIAWPDAEETSISAAKHWATPFLMAEKRMILVNQLLDINGDPDSIHPVFYELVPKKLRKDWLAKIHVNLLERSSPKFKLFEKTIGVVEQEEIKDKFETRALWQVRSNELTTREIESASSLEQLLGCELAYVLNYKAGLSGEDRASLQYDSRTQGIIAHEIISLVFKKGPALSSDEAVKFAQTIIDDVIREKAPQLYQKERAADLAYIKSLILEDIRVYARFLELNHLEIEDAEKKVERGHQKLGNVDLVGTIDHILKDVKGNLIIVDHKFGKSKYREESLAEGRSLQLALYSKLIQAKKAPTLAYHMIAESKILVLNESLEAANRVDGDDAQVVLDEAKIALEEKQNAMITGKLFASGLEDDNEEQKFAAPCRFCEFSKICGLAWKVANE